MNDIFKASIPQVEVANIMAHRQQAIALPPDPGITTALQGQYIEISDTDTGTAQFVAYIKSVSRIPHQGPLAFMLLNISYPVKNWLPNDFRHTRMFARYFTRPGWPGIWVQDLQHRICTEVVTPAGHVYLPAANWLRLANYTQHPNMYKFVTETKVALNSQLLTA